MEWSLWNSLTSGSIGETVCKVRRKGFDFFHFVIFAPYFYGIEFNGWEQEVTVIREKNHQISQIWLQRQKQPLFSSFH